MKTENDLGRKFVITREFAAPRELVFQAWTDPEHVAQWWGPRGFTNPICQWNAVAGEPIFVVMRGPDGTDYPMGGEFREITPPERLVMACGALNEKKEMLFEFVHDVTFTDRAGKTLVTVNSRVTKTTAEAGRYIGGFEMGMTMSLDRLSELLEKASATADRELVISREFDAPREMVWRAMTDPAQVTKWWGPRGFTTTTEVMNVKPGGIWKHVMHGPDGTDYPNKSIFTEVVEHERIVYTHTGAKEGGPGVSFVATWLFDALPENRTRLTLRQVFPSAEDRDMVVRVYGALEGSKQMFARLADELPKMPLVIERTFDAPVALVWKALTNADDIREWSFDVSGFKPEVGFTFEFTAKKGEMTFVHHCQVTEAVPLQRLAYSWKYEGHPGESLVTIDLIDAGTKTHLKLTHTGLETFPQGANSHFALGNFMQGWTKLIGTFLKEHVEKK